MSMKEDPAMSADRYGLLTVTLIAVSGFLGCAPWKRFAYEGWGRDGWQKPDEVVRVLDLSPGSRVADLGSGGGYFTIRLARAVGVAGNVYAVDVDQSMLDYVAERAREEGLGNVETVKAAKHDPRLPGPVDLIFISNTYHHLPERAAYLRTLKQYLGPGGRIAIIEHKNEGFFARLFGHATDPNLIRDELTAAGYQLQNDYAFLPRQSFQTFTIWQSEMRAAPPSP
jgi:ubiquinone/menaquinone biosynthesis C-methylase UbiE